jgi:uncharacterized protein YjiS (DUF1127 family)
MMSFRRWLARLHGSGRPARRADVGALLGLDDRMLADIGLRRAEVAAVANGQLPLSQLTDRGLSGPIDRHELQAAQAELAERARPAIAMRPPEMRPQT